MLILKIVNRSFKYLKSQQSIPKLASVYFMLFESHWNCWWLWCMPWGTIKLSGDIKKINVTFKAEQDCYTTRPST